MVRMRHTLVNKDDPPNRPVLVNSSLLCDNGTTSTSTTHNLNSDRLVSAQASMIDRSQEDSGVSSLGTILNRKHASAIT